MGEHMGCPCSFVTFLLTAGIAALCATVLVIATLVWIQQSTQQDLSRTLLPFWVGDLAGVVVLTPLFAGILIRYFPDTNVDLAELTRQGRGSFGSLRNTMALNISLVFLTMPLARLTEAPESSFAIFFLPLTHMSIACTETPHLMYSVWP